VSARWIRPRRRRRKKAASGRARLRTTQARALRSPMKRPSCHRSIPNTSRKEPA